MLYSKSIQDKFMSMLNDDILFSIGKDVISSIIRKFRFKEEEGLTMWWYPARNTYSLKMFKTNYPLPQDGPPLHSFTGPSTPRIRKHPLGQPYTSLPYTPTDPTNTFDLSNSIACLPSYCPLIPKHHIDWIYILLAVDTMWVTNGTCL